MKPINPQLGASTLRISRIADLDIESKSWDSVVFQQGKSILDFDLNVMQRILRENVSQISRTIYSSGFLTQSSCAINNTTTVRLYDSRVNFFGTLARIGNPSTVDGTGMYLDIACDGLSSITNSNAQAFLWIELWFQEVVPASTAEKIDGSTTSVENKSFVVPKYGGESNTSITNEMYDANFGAETSRRVQVRWRIRKTIDYTNFTSSAVNNTSSVLKGFETPDGQASIPTVYAQGGRQTCSFTGYISSGTSGQAGNVLTISTVTAGSYIPVNNVMTITGYGVTPVTISALISGTSGAAGSTYSLSGSSQSAGTSASLIAMNGWFTPTKTFRRADRQIDAIGSDFYVDRDTRVFIAGDGSATDAVALNTVDGRVYGIPIGFYYYNSATSTGIFTDKRDVITTTSGVAINNTLPATIGDTNRVSIGGTAGTNAYVGAVSSNTNASLELQAQGSGDVIIGVSGNSGTQLVSNYSGAIGSPTYSWIGDLTTGVYRAGAGLIDFSSAGTKVAELGTSLASSLTVNTTYSSGGALSTIAVNAGGSGYAVGDIVAITGGTATAIVTSVSNGVIQSGGLSIVSAGSGYTANGTGTGIATSIAQKSLDLIGYGKFSSGIGVSGSLALTTTSGKLSLSGLDASSLAASSLSLTTTGSMNFSIGADTKWTLPSSASALTFGTSSGSSSQLLTLNTLNSRVSIVTTGSGATFTTASGVSTITSGGSITAAGTGYVVGDILTVGSGAGRIAVTTINASGGITGFAVNNAGSGYAANTAYSTSYYVSVSANTLALDASGIIKGSIFSATGDPAGAGATFTTASGVSTITGCVIANAGAGYSVGDVLTVAGGSTLGKITVATISASGGIVTFSVVSGFAGAGYTASTTYTTTAVGTTAGRYLGTTATAGAVPTSGSFVAGDFVLDTTGFVYVYTGSAWSLAGTNTGLTNSWTALQTFSSGVDITGGYGLTLTDGTTGSTKLFGSNGTPFAGMSGTLATGTWKSIATGTSGSNAIGLAVDSSTNYGILYANLNGNRKDIVIAPSGLIYLAGISGGYGLNVADGTNYTSIPNTKISISGTAIAAERANTNSGGIFAITSSSTGSASSKIDFSVAAGGSSGTSLNATTTILSLDGSTNISSFGGNIVFSGISNISTNRSISSVNSGSNVSSTFTISAGNSTGNGTTSLIFQTAPTTLSGATASSSAVAALTIAGTGAATFASTISATSAVFNTTGSEALLVASLSSAEKFRITNAGYVGILTSSPIVPLDVAGSMRTIGPAYHVQLTATAPTISVVSAAGTGTTYYYKVTAHDADTNETSGSPASGGLTNGALGGTYKNSIYWAAVPGALTYSLYRSTDNFAVAANSVRVLQRTTLYTSSSPYTDAGTVQSSSTLPPSINSTSIVGIDGNVGIGTATPASKLDVVAQDALKITGYQPFITLRDSNGSNKGLRIQTASSEALFALDSVTAGTYVTIGKFTSNGLDILQNIFAGAASAEKTSQNGTSFGFNKYVHTTSNSINTAHGYMITHAATSTTPISDYLYFGSYGTDGVATKANALVINGSGQIGIRTVPAADFHVTGTVAGSVAPKIFLPAQAFNLPLSAFPTFFQRDTNTTKYELQYSGTADQVAHTTIVVPSSYSGGNITIKWYWYTATANQAIVWQILAASVGNEGNPNPSTTALGTIASTTNTAGMLKLETYSWTSSSGLNINTVSAGQILYLSLKRFSTDSADTSTETINFHSMIIEF